MELLRAAESRKIDAAAAAQGIEEATLILNAGRRAAQIIARLYAPCRVHFLCGGGNNGADGLAAAENLKRLGFDCRVFLLKDNPYRHLWRGNIDSALTPVGAHDKAELVVDALFGTGLSRALSEALLQLSQHLTPEVVALDMPSGFNSDDGSGAGFCAAHTISFVRAHPAHYLLPAKASCGTIHLADIGVEALIEQVAPTIKLNDYPLLPSLPVDSHKYQRGVVLVQAGGFEKRGAADLAARAASRSGAGLVVVNELEPHRQSEISIMAECLPLAESLADERRSVVVLGCGNGVGARTKENVLLALTKKIDCVIDADGLTSFADEPERLFAAIKAKPAGAVVLTPHEGEFARLFQLTGAKIYQAPAAAELSGAIVVLKGNDTIIAAPTGEVIINDGTDSFLAKAGTGDVLAGLIGGWLAQEWRQQTPLEAVASAVFIHSALGSLGGEHLIASDLPEWLPLLLEEQND